MRFMYTNMFTSLIVQIKLGQNRLFQWLRDKFTSLIVQIKPKTAKIL